MVKLGRLFHRSSDFGAQPELDEIEPRNIDIKIETPAEPERQDQLPHFMTDGGQSLEDFDHIQSLIASVRSQAVEFRVQHSKAASDWTLGLNVLCSRIATLEPLLNKALQSANDRQREVDHLSLQNEEFKQKLADSERQLMHYRPLAMQLDEELRAAKAQLEEGARHMGDLEAEYAKSQGAFNELFQKLATAEAVGRRVAEEHLAYSQKLNENDLVIQTLMHETAQLKSDLTSVTCDLESAQKEASRLSARLGAEIDEHKRTKTALDSVTTQMLTLKKENASHSRENEERDRRSSESIASKDKQIYDLQVKLSGVNSKCDFLNREIQRQRDDLRRHLDHIGNLEGSNRQLLDALSRNAANKDAQGDLTADQMSSGAGPKLRAISD
jgi:chromosome segregation ATPase